MSSSPPDRLAEASTDEASTDEASTDEASTAEAIWRPGPWLCELVAARTGLRSHR